MKKTGNTLNTELFYPKLNFYENSYLFTRDGNGRRWVFGTADDWIVTSNSKTNGRTGISMQSGLRRDRW